MNENTEKRMVANTGYEVTHSMSIGGREILIAENMNDPVGCYFMKAEYADNGIYGQYERLCSSSDYCAVVNEFIGSISRQLEAIRAENMRVDFQSKHITAAECFPNDYREDITGEIVALKLTALSPEYRRGDEQLVFVTHGNGAKANPRGTGVFCYHLRDGKQAYYERHHVQGRIKEAPVWAVVQLDAIQVEQEAARAAAENPVKPQIIAGYTITERVQVGHKIFVLGENPKAEQPYATYQLTEGRTGYEGGHFLSTIEGAKRDLMFRASTERRLAHLGADRRPRSRSEAR
jgi:hypothetical protein